MTYLSLNSLLSLREKYRNTKGGALLAMYLTKQIILAQKLLKDEYDRYEIIWQTREHRYFSEKLNLKKTWKKFKSFINILP